MLSRFLMIVVALAIPQAAHAADALDGTALKWPWALPFLGILLTIATGPLLFQIDLASSLRKDRTRMERRIAASVWARFYGAPVALAAFVHAALVEYVSFIVLLFALYVVAGGILITGQFARHAAGQHCDPCLRHLDREPRRHHRRGDDPHPAAAGGQRTSLVLCACRRVLYFPGLQYRRRADAARRSAAVHRPFCAG